MDERQEASRRFVAAILRATGWTAYRLAQECSRVSGVKMAHTTISRFLTGKGVIHTLSDRTLGKIRIAAATVLRPEAIDDLWLQAQRPPPRTRQPAQKRQAGAS